MKKLRIICSTLILIIMSIIILTFQANAASVNDLTFELINENEYKVKQCNPAASGVIEIPSTYNGLPVTGIGMSAFYHCKQLTRVVIPNSVKVIETTAFVDCSKLETVSLPDSLTSVDDRVFSGCNKLTYTNYNNGKYLGNDKNAYAVLMEAVSKDVDQFQIHPDTKVLAAYTFNRCGNLTEITIPKGVTGIGSHTFSYCGKLKSVTIPDTVTRIDSYAFYECVSLTDAYIPKVEAWCNIRFGDYNATPFKYLKNCYIDGKIVTHLVIPGSVKKINDAAFSEAKYLTEITIQDGVLEIGKYTFSTCTNVTKISIADSVSRLEKGAFRGCSALNQIDLGKGIAYIGEDCFAV